MARITFSQNPETPSLVELGEKPAAMALLVMDEQTKQALINLVNERRRILRKRVPDHVPVVEPVTSVEEALLDMLGGISSAGGSLWFYQNFGSDMPHLESDTPQEQPSVAHALPMKE